MSAFKYLYQSVLPHHQTDAQNKDKGSLRLNSIFQPELKKQTKI